LKLLIATSNPGKMHEFRLLIDLPELELVAPSEIGLKLEVEENGATYAENAALKGRAFSSASGMLTLADDSGLEVEALGGLPGLRSARFVNEAGATDADRRRFLVAHLNGRLRPWTARFRCVVALVDSQGKVDLAEGVCDGEIVPQERGVNGFGYDPVFWIPGLGKTTAELDTIQKNQISHRARAVRAILPKIQEHLSKS